MSWKQIAHFKRWNQSLYSTELTWREAIEFCLIHTWAFSTGWEVESKAKLDRLFNVRTQKKDKLPAYMAITLIFLSLPYHLLRPRCEHVPELLAQQINVGLIAI